MHFFPATALMRSIASTALVCALLSCTTPSQVVPAGQACAAESFVVVDDFEGARRGDCTVLAPNSVSLEIAREDENVINPSPWYAIKLIPTQPSLATVELDYGTWEHRYAPKVSTDGKTWQPLDSRFLLAREQPSRVRFQVPLRDHPVWVAAQELVLQDAYEARYGRIAADRAATLTVLGESALGRPVFAVQNPSSAKNAVLLVGRQHPPEVSGSFAMHAFTETLFADSELAVEFRQHFRIIVIPLLNPDGVAAGHWRHNAGGIDLNRDWGPFTQPETKLVQTLLGNLDDEGIDLRVFVDFHSTKHNVFYTQAGNEKTSPPGFSEAWLLRARTRLDDYSFAIDPRPVSDVANGKNYMYKRYGIPSMTYEVGDESNRSAIVDSARVFAEEFMRLLLEEA